MGENLFEGLPPPSSSSSSVSTTFSSITEPKQQQEPSSKITLENPTPTAAPPPALKSALKRSKPPESQPPQDVVPKKKLMFKMTTDASEAQVIDAMQKIASHIKSTSKFGKASKLAIQLIQAGSVKPGNCDYFFAILKTAMSSPTSCMDASLRADYHALFTAAQDAIGCLNKKQKNQLTTWTIRAVMANDLFTDDSFVFSKAAGRVKEAISSLPIATEAEDLEETAGLKDECKIADANSLEKQDTSLDGSFEGEIKEESDPFGLDALIPSTLKKEDKTLEKKDTEAKNRKEEEETKRFLKSQREALILCLEIAARRYKLPWCQTVIDILVKHAFDNVSRFTSQQRDAIGKLWASIREQQTRRKQGKSVTGKLDVNGFEYLQQKYANEKISIRHAVGGGAGRRAETWLG